MELDLPSAANGDLQDDLWSSDGELDVSSHLDREWQKRRERFHAVGYRDGIIAGKEAIAQEGFNIGFKQSMVMGYNWGLVRGVTGALAGLPDDLKERLIDTEEKRQKLQGLYESVQSVSTTNALEAFHDAFVTKKAAEQSQHEKTTSPETILGKDSSTVIDLENYFEQLQSLDVPGIELALSMK